VSDGLEEHFLELSIKRLAAAGVSFHGTMYARFRDLLRRGVKRLEEGGLADNPEQLQVAEKNLDRLVDGFIGETHQRDLVSVSRSVYEYVIGRYCPAWPFC
jgi:hypothetical protein